MIVRSVIDNSDAIDRFDYFNDAKDTIDWLRGRKRFDLAERLQKRLDEYRERRRADFMDSAAKSRAGLQSS